MKLVIAGSRPVEGQPYPGIKCINAAVERSGFKDQTTEVVSGVAKGVDRIGIDWARANGKKVTQFKANWRGKPGKDFDRMAGMERNLRMARYADAAVLIWDGVSSGTKNMHERMERLGKPCKVFRFPEDFVVGEKDMKF